MSSTQNATKEECHLTGGQLLEIASKADQMACFAFDALCGFDSEISHAVFYSFTSIEPRKKLIRRVAMAHKNEDLVRLADNLCDNWQKVQNLRTAIAHSIIAIRPGPPEWAYFYIQPREGTPTKATKKYIAKLKSEADDALQAMIGAHFGICKNLEVLAESSKEKPGRNAGPDQ